MLIEAREARRLLRAEKDAHGRPATWHEVRSPASGVVLRKHAQLALTAAPPPHAGDLIVVGEWKSPRQIQIYLYLVVGAAQAKLARLCLTPTHGADLHWHYLEDVRAPTIVEPVSDPPGTLGEATMMNDVFIPRMNITNVATPLL